MTAILAALLCMGNAASVPDRIVAAARDQLSWGTEYDPQYRALTYPGGDVPRHKGVCTDVVIRALRAVGRDLQKLIHEDKSAHPSKYPAYPGAKRVDSNIDHRRCPNQRVFFSRFGRPLTLATDGESMRAWKPGDIVFWKLEGGLDHVGIVSDRKDDRGVPFAIHNLSSPAEEPVLTRWTIVGHFRYP